ncbi:MAG TPA: DoxX family protein [Terriglobia bacterium]|nr:DoxX family protein [Terriglobia bacterium]
MDTGILIIRVVFGLAMAGHGAQKLFGWFGGYGIKGTGGFFESLGFRPGAVFATAAGLSEMGGGLLLTVGLFTPLGAAAVLSAMLVAMVSVHWKNGFFAAGNGIELPFLYAVAAVGIALTGGGAISLDRLLGLNFLVEPYVVTSLLVVAVCGGAVTLSMRHGSASVPSKS